MRQARNAWLIKPAPITMGFGSNTTLADSAELLKF
tara:strand:- start:4044 stop:4148 length:105 start_codon:yes stop_codon:yes gene_type:complete